MSVVPGGAADPDDVARPRAAPAALRAFADAGVLAPADVHVAARLGALTGEADGRVLLAVALAVRAPRTGHALVDLATVAGSVVVDAGDPSGVDGTDGPAPVVLDWPAPGPWAAAVAASPLTATGDAEDPSAPPAPLRLLGTRLYLDRLWRDERVLAGDLRARARPVADLDEARLADGLGRLFDRADDGDQRAAADLAARRRLSVVVGGPGTGKTTTVARIVALVLEQAAEGAPPPLVALAAPTGKAAARLEEAVRAEADRLAVAEGVRDALRQLRATTVHRLLGPRPGSGGRFRHDRDRRLPHDLVVVDESSMVALSLMGRLVEAVRPAARLVLVGDPAQLTSVEAGAVLGDVVAAAAGPGDGGRARAYDGAGPCGADAAATSAGARGRPADPGGTRGGADVGASIAVLHRGHRFGGAIAAVADAVGRGDADAALRALADGGPAVRWIPIDPAEGGPDAAALEPVRTVARAHGRAVRTAAAAGDAAGALAALDGFRLLCARRRGPAGAEAWSRHVRVWLADPAAEDADADDGASVGRPLLVTANDHELRLYNGDVGVVVREPDGRARAAFPRAGGIVRFGLERLGAVETVHAMTVHKAQGSQFTTVAVLLPEPTSRVLTRELLYTAVTRARDGLLLVGEEAALRAALARPAARATGLADRLRGPAAG